MQTPSAGILNLRSVSFNAYKRVREAPFLYKILAVNVLILIFISVTTFGLAGDSISGGHSWIDRHFTDIRLAIVVYVCWVVVLASLRTPARKDPSKYVLVRIVEWPGRQHFLVKILIVNFGVIAIITAFGVWQLGPSHSLSDSWNDPLAFGGVRLAVVLSVNFFLLWLTLQPLMTLESVSTALRRGDGTIRVPRPLVTDRNLDNLVDALNHNLNEVQRYRREVESFSSRMAQQLEAERQSLARELHDDVAQNLATLLALEKISSESSNLEDVRSRNEQMREITRLTLDSVRRLSLGMHPSILEKAGLAETLRWYVNELMVDVLPPVTLHVNGGADGLSPDAQVGLFRIVQEALSNVVRHADASHVDIDVHKSREGLELLIADDGKGFQSDKGNSTENLGLISMRERARLLGGVLKVESAPGSGTRIVAKVPMGVYGGVHVGNA